MRAHTRGRGSLLLVGVVLAGAATAAARPRLSPALAFVAAGRMPPSALPHMPDGALQVFVRYDGPEADLRAAGLEPGTHAGRWYTARVRPERLATLALDGAIVEEARITRTQLDESVPSTGAIALRQADPSLDGTGVVVGIVDTGIDITHEDFRKPDGTTRILWLEDFSDPGGGLHPDLATSTAVSVWSAGDIDRALASRAAGTPLWPPLLERDTFGHGTHVAGIAAGTGRATGKGLPAYRYVGMAPGADLVITKATRAGTSFSDADLVDGVAFVFQQAAALGRPAVVNLSIGAQSTAHTGHSSLEEMLAALVGAGIPGRIIVAAAGNDGAADLHASGALLRRAGATLPVDVGAYTPAPGDMGGFGWEIWYPPEGSLTVSVTTPSGRTYGPAAFGSSTDWDTPEGHIYIDHAHAGTDPLSGRNSIYCAVQQTSHGAPAPGRWHITLAGRTPRFDLWLTGNSLPSSVTLAGELDEDDHLTIPATAEDIVSVASYTTRNSWVSFLGRFVGRRLRVGDASAFSGTGPTADGRFKPDLAAPGEYVTSTLSSDALPPEPGSAFHTLLRTLWADDGVHGLLRGTSMATPHVVGAVALLLQIEPGLDAPRLKELLRATARTDAEFTGLGHAWSPRWGFGKLAVDLAARTLRHEPPGPLDPALSAVGTSHDVLPPDSGDVATITAVPKDAAGLPLGPGHEVEFETSAGSWDPPAPPSEWGRFERRLRPGARGQSATITVRVDGVALLRQPVVWFVDARADIGAPLAASGGGGCSPAPGPLGPGRPLGLGIALTLVVVGRARRGKTAMKP